MWLSTLLSSIAVCGLTTTALSIYFVVINIYIDYSQVNRNVLILNLNKSIYLLFLRQVMGFMCLTHTGFNIELFACKSINLE